MSVLVTYAAADFDPREVADRYVRFDGVQYRWCECSALVGGTRWDLRQGTCDESDLPLEVAAQARRLQSTFPSYTAWPL